MPVTVTLTIDVPERGLSRTATVTAGIPPQYEPRDVVQLYAVTLENAVRRLTDREGWRAPVRHALMANDARAREIERLANRQRRIPAAVILSILNTPSDDAIALWGEVENP